MQKLMMSLITSTTIMVCAAMLFADTNAQTISKDALRNVLELTTTAQIETPEYAGRSVRQMTLDMRSTKNKEIQQRLTEKLSQRKLESEEDVNAMLSAADDTALDDASRGKIYESLEKVQDGSMAPVFRKRIKKGDIRTRWLAVAKAGQFKDREAVPDLIDVVSGFKGRKDKAGKGDIEGMVCIEAAKSLGDIGDDRAIPVLISRLGKDGINDDIPKVIAKFGKKAFSQLISTIRQSSNIEQGRDAGKAITMITDKAIIPDLWRLAQDKDLYLTTLLGLTDNTTTPTRDEVVNLLKKRAEKKPVLVGDLLGVAKEKKDIKYLVDIAKSNSQYGGLAMEYLGDLKAYEAVPVLEDLFKNSTRNLSAEAASALTRITGKNYDWRTRTIKE